MGRCFFGAFHDPGDKANDQVAVVNWNPGIRMTPSRECCGAQRYAPDTDTPGQQHSDAGRMVWGQLHIAPPTDQGDGGPKSYTIIITVVTDRNVIDISQARAGT